MSTSHLLRCTTVLLLAAFSAAGCGGDEGQAAAPIAGPSAPSPTSAPIPAVPTAPGALTLSGLVTQETATGRVPVEGVLVEEMTCQVAGCSNYILQKATTDKAGAYHIAGLYPGALNFVWITKDGYEPVGMPPVPTCDNCNSIVTMIGDTELDIELARL